MADQLEAWINTIENIQEQFGHDIREMKRQLARLTKLVENHTMIMAMYSKGTSPFLVQPAFNSFSHHSYPNHHFHASTTNKALLGTYPFNPHSSRFTPNALLAFMIAPRPINQSSGSKGKHSGHKTGRDKVKWDPIPIAYTQLFSKLMEAHLIALFYT